MSPTREIQLVWVEQAPSLLNPASCRIFGAQKSCLNQLFADVMNALEVSGWKPETTGWKLVPPESI